VRAELVSLLTARGARCVAVYWPIMGEIDVRPIDGPMAEQGVTLALPVVIQRDEPMVFRPWSPKAPTVPGVWDIPVPATDETVEPDVVVVPLVGYDDDRHRLGHGGGFYDRTLAVRPRPYAIGVGYAFSRLETIHPQPHDIAMDAIVVG
jgi:5-formyltetrahydrofolate cyclo-ligase